MNKAKDTKIRIENLSKIFGPSASSVIPFLEQGIDRHTMLEEHRHLLALNNISMDLAEHSIEVIMGLSGSGKSTLLRHINRLVDPTAGRVIVDGENICDMTEKALRHFRQRKTAMVFQNFSLLPHKTVIDNIGFGLKMQKKDHLFIRKQSHYWLERVGLKGFEYHYPAQLSGGMKQRVGLARALACDADILMMDEAFSALDPLIRSDMQDILLALQKEIKKTIVFITHDLDEALKIGDSIAILNEGKLIQKGSADQILLDSDDDYVRRFVADVNRSKILAARSIMKGLEQVHIPDHNSIIVHQDSALDMVLAAMLKAGKFEALVEDDKNKIVGRIDSDMMALAINTSKVS